MLFAFFLDDDTPVHIAIRYLGRHHVYDYSLAHDPPHFLHSFVFVCGVSTFKKFNFWLWGGRWLDLTFDPDRRTVVKKLSHESAVREDVVFQSRCLEAASLWCRIVVFWSENKKDSSEESVRRRGIY